MKHFAERLFSKEVAVVGIGDSEQPESMRRIVVSDGLKKLPIASSGDFVGSEENLGI